MDDPGDELMDLPQFAAIERPGFDIVENVDIYFNLHKRVWSLRSRKSGIVIAHARAVIAAQGGRFVVQEAGRQRALRERRKNVHAFVRADFADVANDPEIVANWFELGEREMSAQAVSYNPFKGATFFNRATGEPFTDAACVVMVATDTGAPRCWAIEREGAAC